LLTNKLSKLLLFNSLKLTDSFNKHFQKLHSKSLIWAISHLYHTNTQNIWCTQTQWTVATWNSIFSHEKHTLLRKKSLISTFLRLLTKRQCQKQLLWHLPASWQVWQVPEFFGLFKVPQQAFTECFKNNKEEVNWYRTCNYCSPSSFTWWSEKTELCKLNNKGNFIFSFLICRTSFGVITIIVGCIDLLLRRLYVWQLQMYQFLIG